MFLVLCPSAYTNLSQSDSVFRDLSSFPWLNGNLLRLGFKDDINQSEHLLSDYETFCILKTVRFQLRTIYLNLFYDKNKKIWKTYYRKKSHCIIKEIRVSTKYCYRTITTTTKIMVVTTVTIVIQTVGHDK